MLTAASCAGRSAPPVLLHVGGADGCRIDLDGRAVTQDELLVAARSWRGRTVRIEGDVNTPYKCLGSTIFTVQRAGVKRMSFSTVPPQE